MSAELRSLGDLDRMLHEPARLQIASILFTAEEADFLFLLNACGLTRGNLSAHLSKLEEAGYVQIEKTFRGKLPRTVCRLSTAGRAAFEEYRKRLKEISEWINRE